MREEEKVREAIDQYGDMVLRICFLHAKQRADAEDTFQNVFLKYAQRDMEFVSDEHEKAWLIRVAINCSKDNLKSWFHKNVDISEKMDLFAQVEEENSTQLLCAVFKLPKKYRDVIYLHYYEGYTNVEIAKLLRKKENTIYTWQSRARKMLKEQLGGADFES